MDVITCIKERRTHKDFHKGEDLSRDHLIELVQIAMTAPNHYRNSPWRFVICEGHKLKSLWDKLSQVFDQVFADRTVEWREEKKKGLSSRFLRQSAFIYITSLDNDNPKIKQENYAACSCAIQNLSLALVNQNMVSYWSTSSLFSSPECQQLFQRPLKEEFFVGAIWIGHPKERIIRKDIDFKEKYSFWEGH